MSADEFTINGAAVVTGAASGLGAETARFLASRGAKVAMLDLDADAVSEAAVIGVPDDLKGTEIVCFAVLQDGIAESEELRESLVQAVVAALGKVDRPKAVLFADDLPKTRSAKIVRRLIQKRYLGAEELGDLSSVANPEALDAIAAAR